VTGRLQKMAYRVESLRARFLGNDVRKMGVLLLERRKIADPQGLAYAFEEG
jgi:hypothetical protein